MAGTPAILGEKLLSSVPLPLLSSSCNLPTTLKSPSQQQFENIMMANLIVQAEQARLFQQAQYSMSSSSLGNFLSSAPLSSMSQISSTTPTEDKAPWMIDNTKKPSKLTELLNKKPSLPINIIPNSVGTTPKMDVTLPASYKQLPK